MKSPLLFTLVYDTTRERIFIDKNCSNVEPKITNL